MSHPLDDGRELVDQSKAGIIPYSPEKRQEYFERLQEVTERKAKEQVEEKTRQEHVAALLAARPTDPFLAALRYFEMQRQGVIEEP